MLCTVSRCRAGRLSIIPNRQHSIVGDLETKTLAPHSNGAKRRRRRAQGSNVRTNHFDVDPNAALEIAKNRMI
jgi:hypothetical protein